MGKTTTIADVAKLANVSKSTVSQYLNKRYQYMAEETKEQITLAIKELGYQPNIVARSLKQKTTKTIGLIAANIVHSFSTQIIRTVENVCHEHGFHLMICNADDDPQKEKEYIQSLMAKQVDGIIAFPTGGNLELYENMIESKYPIVFVDRIVNEISIPSVLLDNENAAMIAVQHFIDKGYERIGIMTTTIIRNITPRIERIRGYKKAFEVNGIPINEDYIKSLEIERMQEGIREMFETEPRPQAILAGNDLTLIEVLKYIKVNNLEIPNDIALIGIDDVSFASFYYPPITTIAQPIQDIGKRAANLLLDKINKKEQTNQLIYRYEPELLIREST